MQAAIGAGEAKRGAQLFGQCMACHSVQPGEHQTGPSLAHVWNRKAGSLASFSRYSPALKSASIVWNDKTLDEWISEDWLSFAQRYSTQMPWLHEQLRQRIRNFERVLNAYYPTTTDMRLSGARRLLLRGASAWRYHARVYDFPLELRALQRLFRYQRPETSGF